MPPDRTDPTSETYRQRLDDRKARRARFERTHFYFSQARLMIAVSAVAILIVSGLAALAWLLVPLGLFVIVAVAHGRLLNRRDAATAAVHFYERGLARLNHEWIGQGRTGERFLPANHLYAVDLDLFGRGSVFELLATTRTALGDEKLAEWLLAPATPDVIRERQAAVRELIPKLDLREEIAVLGDAMRIGVDGALLRSWATRAPVLRGISTPFFLAALSLSTIAALVVWATSGHAVAVAATLLVSQGLVARWLQPRVLSVIESVDGPSHELDVLAGLLRIIERERFAAPQLQRLSAAVSTQGRAASSEIDRLAQLVALLESRANVLAAVPAALLLWATQVAFAIERWRARTGHLIPRWLDAAAELEALLAFAALAAEHPDFTFPTIVEGPAQLSATALAHPAMPARAVANDVRLDTRTTGLLVVSGSNMSGKSTFLRAIGVNTVLALAGAPVRATSFLLSPLDIGASIRIEDSLTDGTSRFFAEILRLKQIVDRVHARDGAVLLLLDEILAGTNSHDRRLGAEALIHGVVTRGAIGLVTTHDLALGEIPVRLEGRVANVHFDDRFEDGQLAFDYVLKDGIVRTSNAVPLMRSIGLDV